MHYSKGKEKEGKTLRRIGPEVTPCMCSCSDSCLSVRDVMEEETGRNEGMFSLQLTLTRYWQRSEIVSNLVSAIMVISGQI